LLLTPADANAEVEETVMHKERDGRDGESPSGDTTGEEKDTPEEGRVGEGSAAHGPVSGQVRIAAVEAVVAAGLAPSARRVESKVPLSSRTPEASTEDPTPSGAVELPDWTDPPTGQVPRVLLEEVGAFAEDPLLVRGPSWREEGVDWDEDFDLSIFVDDTPSAENTIAGTNETRDGRESDPFGFGDLGLGNDKALSSVAGESDDAAWTSVLGTSLTRGAERSEPLYGRPRARRRGAHRAPRSRTDAPVTGHADVAPRTVSEVAVIPATKKTLVATLTGIIAAAFAILCFLGGSVTSLFLVMAVVVIASGEAYGALRRAGFATATLPGILAVGGLPLAAYLHGASGIVFVAALFVVVGFFWYLAGVIRALPVANFAVTLLVVCWVGLLACFAGLLLSPSAHPFEHGVALIVGVVGLTVAHDVGSYAFGSLIGRHKLAPTVSPNKTVEGLIGGTVLAFVVAVLALVHLHPFTMALSIELAVVVVVFAPLGDLVESLIKRDLGVKDMGRLLPGHGGILDRVDAMLFVLPAAYYLVSVHHIV